jgi:hypothetical protein
MASNNYSSRYVAPSAVQYNNYVMAPTIGPLSTSQTPAQINYHSRGVLNGVHPNPPQYYPSDGASEFSNARHQYNRTATTTKQQILAREKAIASGPNRFYFTPTQRATAVSTHMNYIVPPPSSLYTSIKKSVAVGKSSYKQGLPPQAPMTYKNYEPSFTRTKLRRARSGGCVAPAKKGSIFNRTCTVGGGICNIGAIIPPGY